MNRLGTASSPYLRQHAENPVDWHEWGEEAFARARAEDKPVFLSVGYSSCHWCHVMAHESFEDDAVAAVLNEHFVPVKVDREERPDVDSVYMAAVQALTGRGGWPMSVFLTPDGTPFFGGTYWPRDDRHGMPGFLRVLDAVSSSWAGQRDQVVAQGRRLAAHLQAQQEVTAAQDRADAEIAASAAGLCVQTWDARDGGFGMAPKFPQAMTIDFLLAHHLRTGDTGALRAATHSLDRMSRGGIYDHVGGGFARYSVDAVWLVPHFEKMLYDNALLLRAYTHAYQVSGNRRFRRVAMEVAEYLLREMRSPAGGFYSATDADSEGQEGKFFVWSKEEFDEVVRGAGEDPPEWGRFFGVTPEGNFEGANILSERIPDVDGMEPGAPEGGREDEDAAFAARLERVRAALYERREQRVHPGLDDKILTSWNALVLGALAECGAALGVPRYIDAARECAAFLRRELWGGGALRHTWKQGHGASVGAFLEDVACLAQALLVLYEADAGGDSGETWFTWARELAADADARFAEIGPDGPTGAYFSTAVDAERLLTRPKDLWDNATPAGSSVMVDVHLRLAALTGDGAHEDAARRTLGTFVGRARQAPTGYGELLRGLERLLGGPQEVAVVGHVDGAEGEDRAALVRVYREAWRPGSVLAVGAPREGTPDAEPAVPLLAGRGLVDGRAAAYVCRRLACERPVTDPAELRRLLG